MKIEEFMQEIQTVENYYQKQMTDEQKKIWFENLKSMNVARFKYIIAHLFKTSKFIPKLADIYEVNSTLGNIERPKEEQKEYCAKCKNTGYVTYKKTIKNGDKDIINEYGALCSCNRKKQYKGWEISEERYRTDYYVPLAVELGI